MSNPVMTTPNTSPAGKVYLVGAGPGDPGLITVRGAQCLRQADVVLYDYLVNARTLEHAAPDARRICLGRHGGQRQWTQDEIIEHLIELAAAGQVVVRLKGGDPLIFGRLAEEAGALAKHGIAFEVVPGVTAALAAGSYAGIPVTHRDLASAVALIAGQERAHKHPSLDFEALAKFPGTLVFYMGVTTASEWTEALIRGGKSADTPAAIVRKCSLPGQQTIRCRLDEVPQRLKQHGLRPPAVVIVGQVALSDHSLTWFERRPLFGQTVLVTRPRAQVADLAGRFAELGAEVLIQPAIQIGEPSDWTPVDDALTHLDTYDWVVFSSANGVRSFMERLFHRGGDLRRLGRSRLACIGPGTAEALREYHLVPDAVPEQFRAESLAEALAPQAAGKRILVVRASRGREVLAEQLTAAGGEIQQIVAYTSTDATAADTAIHSSLAEGRINWATVTSSAIARSMVKLYGQDLRKTRLASISPITSQTLRSLGFLPAVEASVYTMEGVVEAILEAQSAGGPAPETGESAANSLTG